MKKNTLLRITKGHNKGKIGYFQGYSHYSFAFPNVRKVIDLSYGPNGYGYFIAEIDTVERIRIIRLKSK
jgi:hypothetical protein